MRRATRFGLWSTGAARHQRRRISPADNGIPAKGGDVVVGEASNEVQHRQLRLREVLPQ
jgi:hypothetical protein